MDAIACRRCGYTGPADARYCARCGCALAPLRVRSTSTIHRLLDNLSPRYVALLGLIALVPIGMLVDHLLVNVGLYLPLSFVLLALVIGFGCAYVGWHWQEPSSGRSRLTRVLLVLVCLGLSLYAIWWIDGAFTSVWADNGRTIVSDIPGVHHEASDGFKRLHIVSSPPPYWVFTVVYATLAAVAGGLTHRAYLALVVREKEVRDLRESLLVQTHDAAIQQERNRLARELHDSIKQQVFSINISAAAAQARWESDPDGARAAFGDVRRSAQEVMVEMNALLQQLSPVPLEKVGLRQALRDQCEALGYRTGAEVVAEFGELPDDDRLPAGAQESLFRIAQEALSNVARHARAGQVRLYLGQCESHAPLVLEIQDDGQGFDIDADHIGMGLDNIRQRVRALGGKLQIDSARGAGTRLRASIPLLSAVALRVEDLQVHRQDHTLNKTILVGFGGGLMLIATLFYPLYVLLPSRYVDGWAVGSSALGFVLEMVAALLVVATGLLAARWVGADTRQNGTLFGALAGGVAGAVVYFGLGAPAAGVVGNSLILAHGLAPAAGGADLARLLSEATVGIAWGSYGAFWIALLVGLGLGAIGGLLAPPAIATTDRVSLRPVATLILSMAALLSEVALAIAFVIFPLLESTVRRAIAEHSIIQATTFPLGGISLWPIGTATILYLVSMLALWGLVRSESRMRDPARLDAGQAMAILFLFVNFCLPGYILLVRPQSLELTPALRVVSVVATVCSLILGVLFLTTFLEIRRQRRALDLGRPPTARAFAAVGAILSLAAMVWAVALPSFLAVLIALVLISADIALIVILRRQSRPSPPDTATLSKLHLSVSQAIHASLGSVAAMIVPLMPLISVSLSLVVVTIRIVPVLANYQVGGSSFVPDYTLVELVRNAYSVQARAVLLSFVAAIALVGLVILVLSGRIAIARWRVAQDADPGE